MTEDDARHFANSWIGAWNGHKLESILSHYDQEIEFSSPLVASLFGKEDGLLKGKESLREYFSKGLSLFPDLRFELVGLFQGVNCLIIRYRGVQGRFAAEYIELNPEGKAIRASVGYQVSF